MFSGNFKDLPPGHGDLLGGEGMNAAATTGFHAEAIGLGKFKRFDQDKEIGLIAELKLFACSFNVLVISSQSNEQITTADQGRAEGGLLDAVVPSGLDQHS